jgi:hypothetical protein
MEMSTKQKSLIDHIEEYLGPIQRGWNHTPEGEKIDPQIVECLGGRIDQTRAFCTVGLSRHKFSPEAPTGPIRQELLILGPESSGSKNIPAVLHQLASDVLRQHRAFLCGDLIERQNPIFQHKQFYAFVAAVPVLLPDDFAVYKDDTGNQIVFAWMVPITKPEAVFVREEGWSKLEDMFITQHADLVDFDRESIIS